MSSVNERGGMFSVALSVAQPIFGAGLPGVTWHTALWSSDFPLPVPHCGTGSDRPVQLPTLAIIPLDARRKWPIPLADRGRFAQQAYKLLNQIAKQHGNHRAGKRE
jgi:hypothetical protein